MPFINLKIKDYLNRAYPYYYSSWHKVLLILGSFSVLSFLFSYVFEPFEVNQSEHKLDYGWICFLHAFVPFCIAFIYFRILDKVLKDEGGWTIGKEAFYLSILLLVIGIGSFSIRDIIYDKPDNWSMRYFWEEIRNTFLVGALLLTVLLPLNLERLFLKYRSAASGLNFIKDNQPSNTLSIHIKTPIATEGFELHLSSFLFAKVDGNYTEVYWQENYTVKKSMVRLSLKDLKKQLSAFLFVFETHRSYLVNVNNIKTVTGNAQGYLISFEGSNHEVPVSRSKIAEFNSLFPSTD